MSESHYSLEILQDIHLKKGEASPYGQIVIDQEGSIFYFNRKAELIFGWAREEVWGKSIDMLVPAEFVDEHIQGRNEWFNDPREIDLLAPGKRRNGSHVELEISLSPMMIVDVGTMALAVVRMIKERDGHRIGPNNHRDAVDDAD